MSLSNLVPFQRKHLNEFPGLPRGWDDLHREMDRIFDSFFGDALPQSPLSAVAGNAVTSPVIGLSMDVAETNKAYIISADLPGLVEDDIDLSVADGVLTLKGEKKQETETGDKTFHRIERSYGSFRRVLQLPSDADESAISATMKNGVLTIEIAKNQKAEPSSRKISIRKT